MGVIIQAVMAAFLGVGLAALLSYFAPPDPERTNIEWAYDFVIVGGGTAGNVLAHRLSADESVSVLLIEAGHTDEGPRISAPAAVPSLQLSKNDWQYRATAEFTGKGLNNSKVAVPSGRILGGSSSIGYLLHTRGNPNDYDYWNSTLGIQGWGYEDVLPLFKRSESFEGDGEPAYRVSGRNKLYSTRKDRALRGAHGPMEIHLVDPNILSETFVKATIQVLEVQEVDYNGAQQVGVSLAQVTRTAKGERVSTSRAYLHPVRTDRKNLDVATNVLASKILFDKSNKKASGLQYRTYDVNGRRREESDDEDENSGIVHVQKELIIAGGVFKSPQLLLASGIGPADDLRRLDIPVVADLPVGTTLIDPPSVTLEWATTANVSLTKEKAQTLTSFLKYLALGTGMMTSTGYEAVAFLNLPTGTSQSTCDDEDSCQQTPDVQLTFRCAPESVKDRRNKNHRPFNYTNDHIPEGFSITVTLLHPKSLGYLRVHNDDIHDHPDIHLGHLKDSQDRKDMIDAIKMAFEIVESDLFYKFSPMRRSPVSPQEIDMDSDDYWEWFLQHFTTSSYNTVGTNKMGTVVEADLKMKGIQRLRVVDASVIPTSISGNTGAASVMVAEKAAQDILKEHHLLD